MAKKDPLTTLFYIFLLGATTYMWWKITAGIKKQIAGEEV